jgi:hypothetical protein
MDVAGMDDEVRDMGADPRDGCNQRTSIRRRYFGMHCQRPAADPIAFSLARRNCAEPFDLGAITAKKQVVHVARDCGGSSRRRRSHRARNGGGCGLEPCARRRRQLRRLRPRRGHAHPIRKGRKGCLEGREVRTRIRAKPQKPAIGREWR